MSSGETVVILEPPERWPKLRLRSLWQRRDLAYFLSWRDVKIRYKQSLFGVGWVILQPLLMMAAFTIVFRTIADVPSQGLPYPVFVLGGLIPWLFFASAVSLGSLSLVTNMPLVTKVYFPRMILPISSVLTWTVDLGVSFVLLIIIMALYGIAPPLTVLLVPLLALLVVVIALAVSLLLSAINVQYRDVRYMLPFLIQLWLFLTPVIYPGASIEGASATLRVIYGLNPMVGVVESFRWAVLGTPAPPAAFLIPSSLVVLALLIGGVVYFLKTEQSFADVI